MATALLAVVAAAAQDVVVDAWRAESFGDREVGAGAAAGVVGYRVAMLATGAGALWLTGAAGFSWPQTYLLAAGAVAVGVAGTFLAPPPPRVAAPSTLRAAVADPLREFLARRGAWAVLAFILVFKLPDVAAAAMTAPFLVKLGFAKEEIAGVRQGLGMLVTIAGTLAGGVLVTRRGLLRSLWTLAALQAASNLGFWALALAGPRLDALTAAVVVENFCAGLVAAGFVGFLTAQCDPRHAAFQYALLSALMAAFRLVGAPAGYLAEALGWPAFFVATALLGLPGMLLLPYVGTRGAPAAAAPARAAAPTGPASAENSAAAALRPR
jgi:PAT family beta-lactamase induction signal transducer AmpG